MELIRKPADIIGKKTISAIIYGQSGAGKTALACSAPSPVLFDFDGGVGRLDFGLECDTVQVEGIDMAFSALQEVAQAACYSTVIVDTLSKLVDMATMKRCGMSVPAVKDWQYIYSDVKRFITSATSLGLNIIFVAQDKEVKKSGKDDNFHRPECPEKIYSTLKADVDIIGYLYYSTEGGREVRTITFNPTTYSEGKNTAAFNASYIIPTASPEKPLVFMTDIVEHYVRHQKEKDRQRAELHKQEEQMFGEFELGMEGVTDAASLNGMVEWVRGQRPVGECKLKMLAAIKEAAAKMGLTYNKEGKCYE